MINKELNSVYNQLFGSDIKSSYKAPARVNLIGEHIDYNGGKVLPATIGLYTYGYFSFRDDNEIHLYSLNTRKLVIRKLDDIDYNEENGWGSYPLGVVRILNLTNNQVNKGFNIMYASNIPLGSGLSSSAAILDLTAYILNNEFNLGYDNKEVSLIGVRAEREYCGLSCGIMDEAAIALGKKNKAILIDCAKYEYEYLPFELGDYRLLVMKTNKPRSLTDSKYNERVNECNQALSVLKKHYNIENLTELKSEELNNIEKYLNNDVLFRRVRHVVTENERVYQFKDALIKGDVKLLGKLFNESHQSLRDDYEVTGTHLDSLTDLARTEKGCLGARMTGAGFGGCAIAIVHKDSVEHFKSSVNSGYYKALHIRSEILECEIPDGVGIEE
ncbi:MAG: galactokinase [Acholeplasmatales bacterium]|nr:galactokinase [Acholeplasmatales bacterium]